MAAKKRTEKMQEELQKDLKWVVDEARTSAMAMLGATDLAVERMREAQDRLVEAAKDFDVSNLPEEFKKARKQLEKLQDELNDLVSEQLKDIQWSPGNAVDNSKDLASKAQSTLEELAERGEDVVERIRNQKPREELKDQLESTVSASKDAVTTARKAAVDREKAAVATIKTAGKEARTVAGKVVDMVERDTKATAKAVKASAKRTRAAAKKPKTTAKAGTKRTTSRAKTNTSARKPAKKAATAKTSAAKKTSN